MSSAAGINFRLGPTARVDIIPVIRTTDSLKLRSWLILYLVKTVCALAAERGSVREQHGTGRLVVHGRLDSQPLEIRRPGLILGFALFFLLGLLFGLLLLLVFILVLLPLLRLRRGPDLQTAALQPCMWHQASAISPSHVLLPLVALSLSRPGQRKMTRIESSMTVCSKNSGKLQTARQTMQ